MDDGREAPTSIRPALSAGRYRVLIGCLVFRVAGRLLSHSVILGHPTEMILLLLLLLAMYMPIMLRSSAGALVKVDIHMWH